MKRIPQGIEELSRTVVRFAAHIAAGASGSFEYPVRKDCTIEAMHVRFYFGCQLSVHLDPYLMKSKERRYNIVDYPKDTLQYIAGEDEPLDYKVSVPCDVDDVITVDYVNTDGANAYDIVVAFELDFMGGGLRVGGAY